MKKTIILLVLSFLMLISAFVVQAATEQEELQPISIAEVIRSFYIEENPEMLEVLNALHLERVIHLLDIFGN